MTTEAIKSHISSATKGDREAIEALMNLGEQYLKEGDATNAAQAFKEAAVSYRIDSFRQRAHLGLEHETARWRLEIIEGIFLRWIRQNPEALPITRPDIDSIPDQKVLEALSSSDCSSTMRFLEQTLEGMGVEFFSPGGSPLRRVLQLLRAFGGHDDPWSKPLLRDIRIRVGLDLLADHVAGSKPRPSL